MPPLDASLHFSGIMEYIDAVERMEFCRSVYKKYLEQQKAQLSMITTNTNSDTWDKHMHNLRNFKDKNGHCRVPRHYEENPKLGRWVMNVRSHFQFLQKGKKSSLVTDERLKQLQDIDFEFTPKTKSHTKYYIDRWVHHLKELYRFKERHGHCRVPQRFTDNKKLGGWVLYVRHQYRKHLNGQSSTLTPERIEQLMELGFDFEPRKGRPGRSNDSLSSNS